MVATDQLRQVAFNRDLWICAGRSRMNRHCRDQVAQGGFDSSP
jgi:hypothetical protein